jgi:heme-degrading monooxygenase HmoA
MYITVTYIRLRSVWKFFALANHVGKTQIQTQNSPGFIQMKRTGWGKLHYTLSAWESEAALKVFMRSGAHLEAMKQSKDLSTDLGTYTYEAAELPDWKTAKALVMEKGRILTF